MISKSDNTKRYPIKARSHLLHLLGDELIGDDRLAVFELVKNGYDADANEVKVILDLESGNEKIIVEDNGHGMSLGDITDKWLELATDSKRTEEDKRSKKYGRLPLGEKGIGRFAAFKLGNDVTLITRMENGQELKVDIDWDNLIGSTAYLDGLGVDVVQLNEPKHFIGEKFGTRVEIKKLQRVDWKRGDIRALYRLVTSLSSPFDTPEAFNVSFKAQGRESDYSDMLKPEEFIEQAIWKYTFEIHGEEFSWSYSFTPPHWKGLQANSISKKDDRLLVIPLAGSARKKRKNEPLLLDSELLKEIGPITGVIHAYHRRSEVLKATSNNQTQLKNWLDDQSGVRVYRDGVRVFNYGEPSDDWLGLNAKRINRPSGLGTRTLVATVNLQLDQSNGLKEKTNREGFENNDNYEIFHRVVNSIFEHFREQHEDDRKKIDDILKGRSPGEKKINVHEAVESLTAKLENHPDYKVLKHDLDAIEDQFIQVRDVMVNAGIAGLNLAVVFHEVEHGVEALMTSLNRGANTKDIRQQIEHIQGLLHTFAPLLKKNPLKNIFASKIIDAALDMRKPRFRIHNIITSAPILTGEEVDFTVKVPPNLVVGALGNLLDNAIYWSRLRREKDDSVKDAGILVTTDWDKKTQSGLIAVVDNGEGFSIPIEKAIEPFVTRRPEGMGLGLYYANLVMEQCGGELTLHDAEEFRDEVEISSAYDGAAVVLRFVSSS